MGTEQSWHFQHLAQGSNCLLLLYTAVPIETMTMDFVELDECVCVYSFFLLEFISRIAVIWISSPQLSYVCHTLHFAYMCS